MFSKIFIINLIFFNLQFIFKLKLRNNRKLSNLVILICYQIKFILFFFQISLCLNYSEKRVYITIGFINLI